MATQLRDQVESHHFWKFWSSFPSMQGCWMRLARYWCKQNPGIGMCMKIEDGSLIQKKRFQERNGFVVVSLQEKRPDFSNLEANLLVFSTLKVICDNDLRGIITADFVRHAYWSKIGTVHESDEHWSTGDFNLSSNYRWVSIKYALPLTSTTSSCSIEQGDAGEATKA